MHATILNSDEAILRAIQIVTTFSDLERMAHGEEPKQPGFAELMQLIAEQNKMFTANIIQQGNQLTGGIVEVKKDVDELEQKVDADIDAVGKRTESVETQLNDLTHEAIIDNRQKEIDQYSLLNAYLISYKDNVTYSDAIKGLRRKIKGIYLPERTKVTEIPSRLQPAVIDGLYRSVTKRLKDNPEYYYRLSDYHQKFLIEHGYSDL